MRIHFLPAVLLAACFSLPAGAGTFKTVAEFNGKNAGALPMGGMIVTKQGTVVGTTNVGGIVNAAKSCGAGCGTIFEYMPATGTVAVLHQFTGDDGHNPNGDLVVDKNGMIYGTTGFGGENSGGTIFKIDPATKAFTTLYAFGADSAGTNPNGLTIDPNGILYGSTFDGGARNFGTLFEYNPAARKMTVLHAIGSGKNGDAYYLNSRMVIDKNGMLYGASPGGGANNLGTLFKFSPASRTISILHSFTSAEGQPQGGLAINTNGMLLGVTSNTGTATDCQPSGCGRIYRFNPVKRVIATLYKFTNAADGSQPGGDVVLNSGLLYGEALAGGAHKKGTLYGLNLTTLKFSVLHAFTGGADGAPSFGQAVSFDAQGGLYGATSAGGLKNNAAICGSSGCGVLFKVTQ